MRDLSFGRLRIFRRFPPFPLTLTQNTKIPSTDQSHTIDLANTKSDDEGILRLVRRAVKSRYAILSRTKGPSTATLHYYVSRDSSAIGFSDNDIASWTADYERMKNLEPKMLAMAEEFAQEARERGSEDIVKVSVGDEPYWPYKVERA